MENATISIIVPVYNRELFLDKCIDSLVNQTYRELEIILVDDGSTDSSLEKCRAWEAKDPRIVVIVQENGGVSSARNAGIAAATGTFIGFADSDDSVEPEMFETLVTPMLQYEDIDISSCGFEYIYLDADNSHRVFSDKPFRCTQQEAQVMLFDRKNNHHFKGYTWNKLYRSSIIREHQIRFDTKVRIG